MTAEERMILAECARRMDEVEATPKPRNRWDAKDLEERKAIGPEYRPSEWFGDGGSVPERHRSRLLKAIWSLAASGLLTTTSRGGRLTNIKLTDEGRKAAIELAAKPSA